MANDVKHKVGDTVYWVDLLNDEDIHKGIIDRIKIEKMPDVYGDYHEYGIYYLKDPDDGFIMAHQALPEDDERIAEYEKHFRIRLRNDVYATITCFYGLEPCSENSFVADMLHDLAKRFE